MALSGFHLCLAPSPLSTPLASRNWLKVSIRSMDGISSMYTDLHHTGMRLVTAHQEAWPWTLSRDKEKSTVENLHPLSWTRTSISEILAGHALAQLLSALPFELSEVIAGPRCLGLRIAHLCSASCPLTMSTPIGSLQRVSVA